MLKSKEYIKVHVLFIIMLSIGIISCKKYLDIKPDKSLAIPTSLIDLQALLDNYSINTQDPLSGEVSANDYYLNDADWAALKLDGDKRMYLWKNDYLFDSKPNEWLQNYSVIYYANTVLERIGDIPRTSKNQTDLDNIKGQALFFRAKAYLQTAFSFCLSYDENTADKDLGLPIRRNTNFNEISVRSSVRQTYDQIINDLKAAAASLPNLPLHVMRGSKAGAFGLLSRTYLSMRRYHQAGLYADSCLQIKDDLIDYNELSESVSFPFTQFNVEVIHESMSPPVRPLRNNLAKINDDLYQSYVNDDLRKIMFFKDNGNRTYGFKGSYEGGAALFTGLATDEMYLNRAECHARNGDLEKAIIDLTTLLKFRIKDYSTPTFTNKQDAIEFIIKERRKELLMRGIRWMDIKRLNKEGHGISLSRTINGMIYTLPPNDLRFALPIPEDVIELSGMKQNPRK